MQHKCSPIYSLALALLIIALDIAPALACGIYLPREGEGNIVQERALVRWLDGAEDIVMEMSVTGDTPEAAWILPVPAPATAQLADAKLFDELQEFTKPTERVEVVYGDGDFAGGAAPPGAVTVLGRQSLGPFEVSSLAATDAGALDQWLAENGYKFPEGIADVLQYYVDKGWYYIAIRLQPQTGKLEGALDPLWISFASNEIVYPMRAAGMGQGSMPVFLYILADHRVQRKVAINFGNDRLTFAGWVKPEELSVDSTLMSFVDRPLFLTKFDTFIYEVHEINQDFAFTFAANDELFRDELVHYEYRSSPLGRLRQFCPSAVLPMGLVLGAILMHRRRQMFFP